MSSAPPKLAGTEVKGQLNAIANSLPKGGKGFEDEAYWILQRIAVTGLNREQQLSLAKALSAQWGAVVTFPSAREHALRQELGKISQSSGSTRSSQKQEATPVNAAMKGSDEEKFLHAKQKQLREKRVLLGLAKNDTQDPRIADEVAQLKAANTAFQAKKEALKAQLAKAGPQ